MRMKLIIIPQGKFSDALLIYIDLKTLINIMQEDKVEICTLQEWIAKNCSSIQDYKDGFGYLNR